MASQRDFLFLQLLKQIDGIPAPGRAAPKLPPPPARPQQYQVQVGAPQIHRPQYQVQVGTPTVQQPSQYNVQVGAPTIQRQQQENPLYAMLMAQAK